MTAGKIFQWLDVRECSLKSREITWPYTDRSSERATVRPHHRETNVLLSHFLASLGDREETNCTSMLWSTDSCQNRVSADQYHQTVPRAQVSTHRVRVFLKLSADKLPVSNDRRLKFIFPYDSYEYVVFISLWPRTVKILIWNWPRTPKFSEIF